MTGRWTAWAAALLAGCAADSGTATGADATVGELPGDVAGDTAALDDAAAPDALAPQGDTADLADITWGL